ncbi:MAG: wax ester/triacylglycerol synthase family O-acyltransferase [Solirubrobacterales bacterium]
MESAAVPLQPADRKILEIECETIAGHTCKVVRLGPGAPTTSAIRERIGERIAGVPELVRRLGEQHGVPAWVPAEGFDLARRVTAFGDGEPIARAEIPAVVARLFEQRLDRDRPLWQMDVAPLDDGGAVLIWRIHHALADGTAAMRFARDLLWDRPEQTPGRAPSASGWKSPQQEHEDHDRRRRHLAAMIEREFTESVRRSPFDGTIGTARRIAFASVPLQPLHDAARELADATVNDAVLAMVGGSMRRWLEAHHGSLRGVRVRVPVSLHHEGDSAANLDSFFSLTLPLTAADPVERLGEVHAATARRKASHDAVELREFLDEVGGISPRMRSFCDRIEASPRSFALCVSNVPGPPAPVSLLGAPVEAIHSIAEIGERHALRVAVVSLAGDLHFGLCADPAIVDHLDEMAAGLEAEAAELIAVA